MTNFFSNRANINELAFCIRQINAVNSSRYHFEANQELLIAMRKVIVLSENPGALLKEVHDYLVRIKTDNLSYTWIKDLIDRPEEVDKYRAKIKSEQPGYNLDQAEDDVSKALVNDREQTRQESIVYQLMGVPGY